MAIQAQLYQENLGFPLCGSQDWIKDISNNNNNLCGGGGFNQLYLSSHQKNHYQQQQHQQMLIQELQNLHQKNDTSPPSIAYSSQEIDQYIKLHNERLRAVLQEQRRQQMAALVRRVEPKLSALLRDKDEEITRAAKRTAELEELLKRLESENQAWQRVAQENEAMVVSLNNSLEQAREMASCCPNNGADDAESCCEVATENREEEEEEGTERAVENGGKQGKKNGMLCKACNCRSACVLLLPCRHLCSCKACEAFLDYCPVCRTAKKASIEALIF